LSDTCRLIFADRTVGARGRCLGFRSGASKCPVTQIRAFVGPRRSGEQDARTWHSYARTPRARTLPFPSPRRSLSPACARADSLLLVLLSGTGIRPVRLRSPYPVILHCHHPPPPGPDCAAPEGSAVSCRVRMLPC